MKKLFRAWILVAITVPGMDRCRADEVFPVIHKEPIAVQVLDGRSGLPQPGTRVVVVAGYDRRDLNLAIWREESLTDATGQVLLSDGLRNLPLLRIEVLHHHACDAGAEQAAFSIERIRIDGSSGANHCGFAVLANKPGVIAIFIKGSKGPKGLTIQTKQIPRASPPGAEALAPGAEPSVRSAAENSVVRTSEKTPSAHAPLPREATPGDASQLEAAIAALPWFLATPSQGDASLSMAPSSEAAESKIAPRPVSHRVRKTLQCKALPARIPEVGARLDEHSSSPKTFPPPKPDSLAKQVPTDASKAKGSTNDSSPVPAKPSAANAPKPGS